MNQTARKKPVPPRTRRPKVYPDRDGKGAPALNLRLPPELMDWVRARGGQEYVRQLLREMKRRWEDGWGAYAGPGKKQGA